MTENGQRDATGSGIVSVMGHVGDPRDPAHRSPHTSNMKSYYKTVPTPVGALRLIANDAGLAAILWENDNPKRVPFEALEENPDHPLLVEAERQLEKYFAGESQTFTLNFSFTGTQFQKEVWTALTTIPFGETRSYAELAKQIGRPLAVRAVGAANARNPLSIVVPCHRVIGSNGALTGFAGGLETKAFLLKLESGKEARQVA